MVWMLFEPQLPWEDEPENRRRLWTILGLLSVVALLLAWTIAQVQLPPKQRATHAEVPERIAKIVLEQKKKKVVPPPPPPEVVKEEPEKKPEPKPEEKPKPKPKPEPKKIAPKEDKGNREKAREVAAKHLAVFDALADLRDEAPVDKMRQAAPSTAADARAHVVERSMITNKARQGSGGINTAKASRSLGGGRLSGGGSTQVASNLAARKADTLKRKKGHLKPERPAENIERVMDAHKAAIFSLYHRALRKNPGLRGEVIFRIRILPSGKVAKVAVVSSDLGDKALEKKLMARIRLINFGAMDVEPWEDNYRMTFLPS
jgi:outer membrane biosynthesis protein TonB